MFVHGGRCFGSLYFAGCHLSWFSLQSMNVHVLDERHQTKLERCICCWFICKARKASMQSGTEKGMSWSRPWTTAGAQGFTGVGVCAGWAAWPLKSLNDNLSRSSVLMLKPEGTALVHVQEISYPRSTITTLRLNKNMLGVQSHRLVQTSSTLANCRSQGRSWPVYARCRW